MWDVLDISPTSSRLTNERTYHNFDINISQHIFEQFGRKDLDLLPLLRGSLLPSPLVLKSGSFTKKSIRCYISSCRAYALSEDHTVLVTGYRTGLINVYHLHDGQVNHVDTIKVFQNKISFLVFTDPCGKSIAVANDTKIRLINLKLPTPKRA